MEDSKREEMLQAAGLTAPRLTPADIDALIVSKTFTMLPSNKCMVCEITLKNGFTVRGESSVVSKENFREDIGREISFNDARGKIWQLAGYALQERLAAWATVDSSLHMINDGLSHLISIDKDTLLLEKDPELGDAVAHLHSVLNK